MSTNNPRSPPPTSHMKYCDCLNCVGDMFVAHHQPSKTLCLKREPLWRRTLPRAALHQLRDFHEQQGVRILGRRLQWKSSYAGTPKSRDGRHFDMMPRWFYGVWHAVGSSNCLSSLIASCPHRGGPSQVCCNLLLKNAREQELGTIYWKSLREESPMASLAHPRVSEATSSAASAPSRNTYHRSFAKHPPAISLKIYRA